MVQSGPLSDTSTTSCADSYETLTGTSAKLNARTCVSAKAGKQININIYKSAKYKFILIVRFSCKSASYDHLRKECHLSEEDRFTRPEGFVVKQGSDYLENQCESSEYFSEGRLT